MLRINNAKQHSLTSRNLLFAENQQCKITLSHFEKSALCCKRHYFAEGFYVKKTGVTYFRQNISEHTPVITSWPIPTQSINNKHPPNVYFKPHLGKLETLMPSILEIIERSPHITQISKCQNYTATFHTIQQDRSNYHQTILTQETQLLPNIYSYEQTPHVQSDQQTNNIAQANLQRRIDDKAQLFRLLWKNVHLHVLNLEYNLLTYYFQHNEEIRLEIEKRIYHQRWTDYATSQARSNVRRAYIQLFNEINHLSVIIPAIHKKFREMYAMTLQHKAIRLLRDSRKLQPYVLYQHIIKSDFIKSYPLKFDADRATLQRLQLPFSTSHIQSINRSSPNPITPTLILSPSKLVNTSTQIPPLRQTNTNLNQNTYHIQNQTYMVLPWKWPKTSHIRQDPFMKEFNISYLKRRLYTLLHSINNRYIATIRFLANLFHKRINCDT